MAALIYIHGFLSSPLSHKAVQVQQWLAEQRPDISFHCPYLPPYPGEVQLTLEQMVEELQQQGPVYLMGSSMGGYWSTYLAEKYDLRAILINPAVTPSMLMPEYIGVELKNYHTEDTYMLEPHHVDEIRAVDTPNPQRLQNYWLMVQTEDETLDYRLAVDKYEGCKQLVEEGGDHGFQGFERFIAGAIDFLEGKDSQ
ncbi:esterase YqiA [Maricurvus nonylphenolicus]|uniref:YqiA/YcfP family alpha/beta fold hydrolase n=1 Tax=Maricurvus nonylphenolicus TaxID=1008307 RepID=UPI0036F408A9